jgi:hypothetical protein
MSELLHFHTITALVSPMVLQELSSLLRRLELLEPPTLLTSELSIVKAQLNLLEARMPTNTFSIEGKTFHSKADVALFLKQEMPGSSYSIFHDVITLLEAISDGHSKKETVMAAMYQAGRVGLDEDEATHVHSFKLIIPTIMRALREGDKSDHRMPLPTVKDFATWNPQDNEIGIKKCIQDGVEDLSLALQ